MEQFETGTALEDRPPAQARIMAIANQKGGVGKSTTAVNLGGWLALEGYRVLIVDLDPQANASTGVGVDPRRAASNVYEVLVEDRRVDDGIEPTAVKGLFCLPSTIDLAGAEIEMVPMLSREMRLKRALEPVTAEFDYILIDCPPSLGLLTVNALVAATEVLVPIQCEYYALEGVGQLLKNVQLIRSSLNPTLRLAGIVLTMFDARTNLSEQVELQVRGHFSGRVFKSVIPRSVRLAEAPSFGEPAALHDPKSKGAQAYRDLALEILAQVVPVPVPAPPAERPAAPAPTVPEATPELAAPSRASAGPTDATSSVSGSDPLPNEHPTSEGAPEPPERAAWPVLVPEPAPVVLADPESPDPWAAAHTHQPQGDQPQAHQPQGDQPAGGDT